MGFLDFFRRKKTTGDSAGLEKTAPSDFVGPPKPDNYQAPVKNEDPNFVGPPAPTTSGGGGSRGSTQPRDTGIKVITEQERSAGAGRSTIPAVTVGGTSKTYERDQAKLDYMRDTQVYTAPPGREQSRGEFEKTQQNIYFREDQYRAYGKLSNEFQTNPEKFKGATGVTTETTAEGTTYTAGPQFFNERLGGATSEFMYNRAGQDAKQRFKSLDYSTQFKLRSTGTALAVTKGASDLRLGINSAVIEGLGGGIVGPKGDEMRADLKEKTKGPVARSLEGVPQTTADKLTTAGTQLLIVGPAITKGLAGTGTAFKGGFKARGGFANPVRSTYAGGKDLLGFAGAKAVDGAPFGFVQRTYGPRVKPGTQFKGFFSKTPGYTKFTGTDKTGQIVLKSVTPNKPGIPGRSEVTQPVTYMTKSGQFFRGYRTSGTDFLPTSFKSGSGYVTRGGQGFKVKGGTGGGVVLGRDVTYNFQGVKFSGNVNAPSGYANVGYQRGRVIGSGKSIGLSVGNNKPFTFGKTQVKGIDLTGKAPTRTSAGSGIKTYSPSGTITKTPLSKTFQVQAIAKTPPVKVTPPAPKPVIAQGPTLTPPIQTTRTQSIYSGQGLYETTNTGGQLTRPTAKTGLLILAPTVQTYQGLDYKNLPGVRGVGKSKGRTIQGPGVIQLPGVSQVVTQKPGQVFKVKTKQLQQSTQDFKTQGFNYNYNYGGGGGATGGFVPVIIPPFVLPGGADFGSLGEGIPTARASETRYTPSFSAILFGIRGKAPKGRATGFRFRPITPGFKFIRRVKL